MEVQVFKVLKRQLPRESGPVWRVTDAQAVQPRQLHRCPRHQQPIRIRPRVLINLQVSLGVECTKRTNLQPLPGIKEP